MKPLKAVFQHFTPVDYVAIGAALIVHLANVLR